MARAKRKNKRSDHLMIDDRIAVLYGGCDDVQDEPDKIPSPFLQTGMRPTLCRHWRQRVEIEQSVFVHASAYLDRPRTDEWDWPEIGVYLSERWIEKVPMSSSCWAGPSLGPRCQVALLPCPDGGCPLYEKGDRTSACIRPRSGKGRSVRRDWLSCRTWKNRHGSSRPHGACRSRC